LGLFSLFLEKAGFHPVFEIAAGGGGGFEEGEVVFSS